MPTRFLPKTFTVLGGYTRRQFLGDLQADVIVGVVAIPLALAFAIASGDRQGIRFLISGINAQPLQALERAGRIERYGRENFVATLDEALRRASELASTAGSPPPPT